MSNAVETLTKQLPDYFKPIIEFQAIMQAHGYEVDIFELMIDRVWANNYIATCDEQTLAYWENVLGLTYSYGDTLDYRRSKVMQKFTTAPPFSIEFLKDRLTELYGADGYTVSVDPVESKIYITVTSNRYGAIDLLYDLLWDIIPAHLEIYANQNTTTYIGGSRLYTAGFVSTTFIQTIGGGDGTV